MPPTQASATCINVAAIHSNVITTITAMASVSLCVSCSGVVTSRMHALCCDKCERWQHRKCGTGVTPADYKRMTRGELNIDWNCKECQTEVMNSTVVAVDVPPPELDTSAIGSPSRNDRTFNLWAPTMPDITLVDVDVSMDFVNDVDLRHNDDEDLTPTEIPDVTFNLPTRDFVRPDPVLERSIQDPVLDDDIPADKEETFEEVANGSKRGGRKLISSKGFTYTVKRTTVDRVFWACSVRGKKMTCNATVKQYRDMYTPGLNTHIHPADTGATLKVKVAAKVKQVARENVFLPAGPIVEQTLQDMVTADSHCLPSTSLLTRAANLHREKLRPKEPTDLHFEVNEHRRTSVIHNKRRHIRRGVKQYYEKSSTSD